MASAPASPALSLAAPAAWNGAPVGPPVPGAVDVAETHISWVFLGARDVLKVKKPVSLGFLDFRTLDRREAACRAEVEKNLRLAPDVYRGVIPVFRHEDGACSLQPGGQVVDWAVWMRRLPDAASLERRVADGQASGREIDQLAAHVARFHARCDRSPEIDAYGAPAVILGNVRENFEQTRGVLDRYLTPAEANELREWQTRELARLAPVFDARALEGRVRDGHGDLRLEHVYVEGGAFTIIDCVEFAERFRCGDVASDLAFLSMDLAWHGRVDLAERLIAAYAREADDHGLYLVIDFYESYRAFVRGKIASFIAADEAASDLVRQRADRDARRFFLLALSSSRKALAGATLTVVSGLPASGKSTVAGVIGARLAAPVIDADRTRKHMLGVDAGAWAGDAAFKGAYDLAFTEKVYEEVLRRAQTVLASGRPVVVDASFRSREQRSRARDLARRHGVPFLLVECVAPHEACLARLAERARSASSVSDARIEIFDAFLRSWEPITELSPAEHIVWDTTGPHAEAEWSRVAVGWPPAQPRK